MLPITPSFVVYPTRIANVVHYLSHGKTMNPVIVNQDKFKQYLEYLETKKIAGHTWVKKTSNVGRTDAAFYREQATVIQKNTKQVWGAK